MFWCSCFPYLPTSFTICGTVTLYILEIFTSRDRSLLQLWHILLWVATSNWYMVSLYIQGHRDPKCDMHSSSYHRVFLTLRCVCAIRLPMRQLGRISLHANSLQMIVVSTCLCQNACEKYSFFMNIIDGFVQIHMLAKMCFLLFGPLMCGISWESIFWYPVRREGMRWFVTRQQHSMSTTSAVWLYF